MFQNSQAFNQPIGNWDVSSVTNMTAMFYNAFAFNQNLSSWSVDGVTNCTDFSDGASSWTLPQPNFTNCTP
jgi:surface protein